MDMSLSKLQEIVKDRKACMLQSTGLQRVRHSLVAEQQQEQKQVAGKGLSRWLSGKEPACSAGGMGSIPGSGRSPGEENGNPLQYSCLDNPHGQRSLAGYNPWGPKESDMTE